MNNTGVIDQFLEVFTRYIDSGFGLLRGEVAFIASTLIVIDVTLAFLFWALDGAGDDMIVRLIKKTIFVGAFAYIIGNWNSLAAIVFNSFAGLGLKASGGAFSLADLMRPGKLAQTGLDAGQPLVQAASDLMGGMGLLENAIQIVCLLLAWILVVLAFFILAIQMFVVLIEFKLTTLAGFVLMPFGLWGKSAFMAEKVLGNVMSSGIKVLVLAIIVGIGSTLFSSFVQDFGGEEPTIGDAMSIVLAALTLLGLGIFGPGIANGLVSGGPQLGAGSAIGAGLAAGGVVMGGMTALGMAARAGGALAGDMGAAAKGAAAMAGGASSAYQLGALGKQGVGAVAGGLGNVARTGATAAASPLRQAAQSTAGALGASFQKGAQAAFAASGGASTQGTITGVGPGVGPGVAHSAAGGASSSMPDWAKRMRTQQALQHSAMTAVQAIRSGDSASGGHSVTLKESE
jgi:type IV secretion system protein TrbL